MAQTFDVSCEMQKKGKKGDGAHIYVDGAKGTSELT